MQDEAKKGMGAMTVTLSLACFENLTSLLALSQINVDSSKKNKQLVTICECRKKYRCAEALELFEDFSE